MNGGMNWGGLLLSAAGLLLITLAIRGSYKAFAGQLRAPSTAATSKAGK